MQVAEFPGDRAVSRRTLIIPNHAVTPYGFRHTTTDGWCWGLRHGDRPLDECAAELGLEEGMPVVLYYADEVEGSSLMLRREPQTLPRDSLWSALPDRATYRLIRNDVKRGAGSPPKPPA